MRRQLLRSSVLLLIPAGATAQSLPMPEHPGLAEAFLAWDRGDYPAALRGYLGVLNGPEGAAHLEEIALLTGELYRVREVAPDGGEVRIASDGSMGTFAVVEGDARVVEVVDVATGRILATLAGTEPVPGPGGRVAFFRVGDTPELRAALAALQEAGRTRDFGAISRARDRVRWEEARARRSFVWSGGAERAVELGGLAPLSLHYAGVSGDLFALAAPGDDSDAVGIYAVGDGAPRDVGADPGPKGDLLVAADGRAFAFSVPDGVAVHRAGGGTTTLLGATDPTLSTGRGPATLAFLREEGDATRLEATRIEAGREPRPEVLLETGLRIENPAVSPDGRHVAVQMMPVFDWELFVVEVESGEVHQLSLEIQHDRYPLWLDAEHVLAAKGEGRHMRSYVYGLDGSVTKLFHNNTVRTIAPEYEWAASPDGSRVLIVSERDGDTVSPERGVYLVDRTAAVTLADVRHRLEESLRAEEDLRARGRAAFAPVARTAAAVADRVSVGRIYQYARDVYAFGSKHITQPGNALAIEYYADKLRDFGYEPELQWFEPRPGIRSANVIARIPGTVDPDLVYVASSHFDSVERGPGADDDSSGATALLEVARVLKDSPLPATVELAFFTGEEAGLLGSREYVRRAVAAGKRVVGALNNDMVGWANDHRLDNTIRYSNPGIRDIQHAAAMLFSHLITYDALYYKSTDAAAYYEAYGDIVGGIGSYPVLGNPHYHQSHDRLETIDQRLVAEVARTTATTLVLLASSPARVEGLTVSGGTARWRPSAETGISGYEVRWQTDSGWAAAEVVAHEVRLEGIAAGGEVRVRARHHRGTHGWDWARASVH